MRKSECLEKCNTELALRRSQALLPDILKHHNPKNVIQDMLNERRIESFWLKEIDIYLYIMLLGNTADGIPTSLHFAHILSGGVYSLVHLLGCFFLIIPMMYIELFLGYFSKLTNVQMYRMAPIFFGFCICILILNICHVPIRLIDISQFPLTILNIWIDQDSMRTCPINSKECYDILKQGPLNTTCIQVDLGMKCDGIKNIVRYVALYRTWEIRSKANEIIDWKLLLIILTTWLLLWFLLMIGIQSLCKRLYNAFILNVIINISLFLISLMSSGSFKGMSTLIRFNFKSNWTYTDVCIALAFCTSKFCLVKPYGFMTLSAFSVNFNFGDSSKTFLLILFNWLFHCWQMIVALSVSGVLAESMGVGTNIVHLKGPDLYIAVFTQFLNNNQAYSSIIVFMLASYWLLDILIMAIILQLYILNINDCIPSLTRYKPYVVSVIIIIGIIISLSYYLQSMIPYSDLIYGFNMQDVQQCYYLCLQSILLFYCYGVDRLCLDIYYITGSKPLKLWRVIAYWYPVILMLITIKLLFETPVIDLLLGDYQPNNKLYRTTISSIIIMLIGSIIMTVLSMIYALLQMIQHKRVENIFKPEFYFGPPDSISRIGRKQMRLNSSKFQHDQEPKVRFKLFSVHVEHHLDELRHSYKGRIFLEDEYSVNLDRPEVQDMCKYNMVRHKGRLFKRLAKKKMINMRVP